MLNCFLDAYLNYCNMLGLAKNSSKELGRYIKQLDAHLVKERLSGIGHIQYKHCLTLLFLETPLPPSKSLQQDISKNINCNRKGSLARG